MPTVSHIGREEQYSRDDWVKFVHTPSWHWALQYDRQHAGANMVGQRDEGGGG